MNITFSYLDQSDFNPICIIPFYHAILMHSLSIYELSLFLYLITIILIVNSFYNRSDSNVFINMYVDFFGSECTFTNSFTTCSIPLLGFH
jgi:hypothetical protein